MRLEVYQLVFTRPWWLAALAALPVVLYYARRSLVGFGLLRRVASLAMRVLLLAALVAALAGLKISRETSRQFVVLTVDQSRSIAPDAGKIIEHWQSQWHPGEAGAGQGRRDRVVCVPFAAEPGAVATELPRRGKTPRRGPTSPRRSRPPGRPFPPITCRRSCSFPTATRPRATPWRRPRPQACRSPPSPCRDRNMRSTSRA